MQAHYGTLTFPWHPHKQGSEAVAPRGAGNGMSPLSLLSLPPEAALKEKTCT